MTHPVTLEAIGRVLNPPISKQAVAKYVASGVLLRGRDGIDVDDPQNRQWLIDRGADLSVFAPKTPAAPAPTAAPKGQPASPALAESVAGKRKNQHDPTPQTMFTDGKGNQIPANFAIMQQRFVSIQADTNIKQMKFLAMRNSLFERSVVQNVTASIMSEMVNAAMSVPQSIVDNIMNQMVISPDSAREVIVRLLQDAYLHEYRLIGQTLRKKLSGMRNTNADDKTEEEKVS
jgi:hypothetical protein